MLDEMMVRYCAPTLAGIKTGNLMNCTCADRESFLETVNNMAQRLASRGICVMPFTMSRDRILIYIFRPGNFPMRLDFFWDIRRRMFGDSLKIMQNFVTKCNHRSLIGVQKREEGGEVLAIRRCI